MPLYPYRCKQCGYNFEKIQKFGDEPESVCPKCKGVLERPLTAPRFHFVGSGWYVNDYGGKSSEPSMPSTSTETKTPEKKAPAASAAPAAPPAAPASSPAAVS